MTCVSTVNSELTENVKRLPVARPNTTAAMRSVKLNKPRRTSHVSLRSRWVTEWECLCVGGVVVVVVWWRSLSLHSKDGSMTGLVVYNMAILALVELTRIVNDVVQNFTAALVPGLSQG